jgi:hypothetical protein
MNTAAIIAMYLIANEPTTIDSAARAAMYRDNPPVQQIMDSAVLRRAKDAHESIASRVLHCYHPSAELLGWEAAGSWKNAWEYSADHSRIFDVYYRGISGTRYQMRFAVTARLNDVNIYNATVKTFLLADNALIRANPDCELGKGQTIDLSGI